MGIDDDFCEVNFMMNYLKYSGCNVILKLNPFHWTVGFVTESDPWDGKAYVLHLAMFSVRFWIDDGNW
jgi:hypothetical protein